MGKTLLKMIVNKTQNWQLYVQATKGQSKMLQIKISHCGCSTTDRNNANSRSAIIR